MTFGELEIGQRFRWVHWGKATQGIHEKTGTSTATTVDHEREVYGKPAPPMLNFLPSTAKVEPVAVTV